MGDCMRYGKDFFVFPGSSSNGGYTGTPGDPQKVFRYYQDDPITLDFPDEDKNLFLVFVVLVIVAIIGMIT